MCQNPFARCPPPRSFYFFSIALSLNFLLGHVFSKKKKYKKNIKKYFLYRLIHLPLSNFGFWLCFLSPSFSKILLFPRTSFGHYWSWFAYSGTGSGFPISASLPVFRIPKMNAWCKPSTTWVLKSKSHPFILIYKSIRPKTGITFSLAPITELKAGFNLFSMGSSF